MIHFIQVSSLEDKGYVGYYYNTSRNIIGDFSSYHSSYHYNSKYNDWAKYRRYRGEYAYNKKPHREYSTGTKFWHYNQKAYFSYEEYLLAVMG